MDHVYIETKRQHHFVDGFVIPEGEVLEVVDQGREILTVKFDGQQRMVRKSQVKFIPPDKKSPKNRPNKRA